MARTMTRVLPAFLAGMMAVNCQAQPGSPASSAVPAPPSLSLSVRLDASHLASRQITADAQGNIIVVGVNSDCSQVVVHPISGCGAVWIAKLDPTGATILFATYLGDHATPYAITIAGVQADGEGNIVVALSVTGNQLPGVNSAQQSGYNSAYLFKLAADGSRLIFGRYFNDSGPGFAKALALDNEGAIYLGAVVHGYTQSVVAKLSPLGNLMYTTPVGLDLRSFGVDASGSVTALTFAYYTQGYPDTGQIVRLDPDGTTAQTAPLPSWAAPYFNIQSYNTYGQVLPAPDGGYWLVGNATNGLLPITANAVQSIHGSVPYVRIEQGKPFPPSQPMAGHDVTGFAVDPVEPWRIYCATSAGLFESEDNGWTWVPLYSFPVHSVAVDPFDHDTLYVGASASSTDYASPLPGFVQAAVYRSTDRGQSWNPGGYSYGGAISLAADPTTRGRIYAVDGSNLLHSEDGGVSWNPASGLPPTVNLSPSAVEIRSVYQVLADPEVSGRAYVVSASRCNIGPCGNFGNLFQSDDGGLTLHGLTGVFLSDFASLHLAVDPATGDVYAIGFGGQGKLVVFRHADFSAPTPLADHAVAIAFDPRQAGTTYLSLDDGSIVTSNDGGLTWGSPMVKLPAAAPLLAVGDGGVIHASQPTNALDGFAFKYDRLGNLVYGTYFGSGRTTVSAAALAPNGNLLLAGSTTAGIPLANALQPDFGGATDGFVAELDAAGGLLSSTYLGGTGADQIDSLAVLPDGSVLAAGTSKSVDFPARASALGTGDALILRIRR